MTKRTRPGEPHEWLDVHLRSDHGDQCIEWPYAHDGYGYPRLDIEGRSTLVTHLVLGDRPPPPEDQALHSCDNPGCINRTHLRWGSQGENVGDREVRGRTSRGDTHPSSVLAADDVRVIRDRYAEGGVLQRELAQEYGVHPSTISRAIRGEWWGHVSTGRSHDPRAHDLLLS